MKIRIRLNCFTWICIGMMCYAHAHLWAMPSQEDLRIPEPLLFDEVRPLGAKKGEFEVNVLGADMKRNFPFFDEFAPEIEYAIADGYAIEGELPVEQEQVAAYKMAFQGTFSSAPFRQAVHGWQVIALYDRIHHRTLLTGLYLLAARIDRSYSMLVMLGGDTGDNGNGSALLVNPTIFYNLNDRVTLGIEQNIALRRHQHSYLILPQIDYNLSQFWSIQLGAGCLWQRSHQSEPYVAFRLIFNC